MDWLGDIENCEIGTTIRKAESKGKGRNLKREDRENGECVVVSLALAV